MKKILIVEDDAEYRDLLSYQLNESGYSVTEAKDGKEGLEMARAQHPDLILLDILMPVMNGIDMLSELRKDAYGAKAKVILLTNLDPDDFTVKKIMQDQPAFYCIKSNIQYVKLLEKIKELMD